MDPSISILDVGHGNSVVINSDLVTIIDAGPGSSLLEFLKQEKITKIDTFLISHADADHISGLLAIMGSDCHTIDRIILNGDSSKKSKIWNDLVYELDQMRKRGEIKFQIGISEGTDFANPPFLIETICPSPYLAAKAAGGTDEFGTKISSNSLSAAFRVVFNGSPVVICAGDIDHVGLRSLSSSGRDITAPYLIFPHHGGNPGSGSIPDFVNSICDLTKPETVIFSIGRGRYHTPNPDVVAAVLSGRGSIRIACTQLSNHCAASLVAVTNPCLSSKYSGGSSSGACCAGTTVIDFCEDGFVASPSPDDHWQFVSNHVPDALCISCRR